MVGRASDRHRARDRERERAREREAADRESRADESRREQTRADEQKSERRARRGGGWRALLTKPLLAPSAAVRDVDLAWWWCGFEFDSTRGGG